jgi:hypothetical protein
MTFCRSFFDWYNQDHHHAGIGLMTPDQVHYDQTDEVYAARQKTLDRAFQSNPERFVKKPVRTKGLACMARRSIFTSNDYGRRTR